MRRRLGLAALAAGLACASGPASASFTELFAFGDSLSDAGNLYILDHGFAPVSPPYYDGRFSNGPTWVEDLSVMLGLGTLTPSFAGGNDFAIGGAQTGKTAIEGANNPFDLPAQISAYAALHPAPVSGALYTLDIGANDLLNALTDYESGAISLAKVDRVASQAEANTVTEIGDLYELGARNLLFYEIPNLGLTPELNGTSVQSLASALSLSFDTTVLDDLDPLEGDGLKVYDLNAYALLGEVVANPSAYGFTNVTSPCWTGNFFSAASGTLCSTLPAVQDQYLFWDSVHPTEAGQLLAAEFAYALVPEPSTWAMLLIGLAGLSFAGRRARSGRLTPLLPKPVPPV